MLYLLNDALFGGIFYNCNTIDITLLEVLEEYTLLYFPICATYSPFPLELTQLHL